jgi:hypothetical protein
VSSFQLFFYLLLFGGSLRGSLFLGRSVGLALLHATSHGARNGPGSLSGMPGNSDNCSASRSTPGRARNTRALHLVSIFRSFLLFCCSLFGGSCPQQLEPWGRSRSSAWLLRSIRSRL